MNKDVLGSVIAKTNELLETPTCCQELKDTAQAWLNALGTDQEEILTKKYFTELEEDLMPIDQLIEFASSRTGEDYFGKDTAKGIADHAKDIKAQGGLYCDCPACLVVAEILTKKDELLS